MLSQIHPIERKSYAPTLVCNTIARGLRRYFNPYGKEPLPREMTCDFGKSAIIAANATKGL